MKYPNGINKDFKVTVKKDITYGNRGMSLENDLNLTNDYYRSINKAFIYKKPTPIKITKVDYSKGKISEAFFEAPSTTDYNGIYKGFYIDFEAKETINKTSFPLGNIHKHQIEHLRNIEKQNGISFLIVRFVKLNKTFLLLSKDFLNYIDSNDKKSIPLNIFEKYGYQIKDKYNPRVDYLEIIDSLYGGKNG